VLFELRTEDAGKMPAALAATEGAVTIADAAPQRRPLILERIA
jgi:hypothetical protein